MALKTKLEWDQKNSRFVGNVNYGPLKGEKPDTIAENALLFMVAGLQKPLYVPIAYFLTNALDGDILARIITEAITMVTQKGAEVHAVIFDGAPKNITMAEKLGANIKKLDGSFPHPAKPGKKIFIILDVCHMI